ncbi:MAG TPA: tripartite tricarboxylate transporter substrate binding protein [Burkholderiales bacterium]|nr:tripartite tricarboxylate transporter substrate binding protein [Burkholderiales bacterium]
MNARICITVLAGLLTCLASASNAQNYPTRPVRILVPLAAGGGMDTVTRGLAQQLTDVFSQTVVVDNRPGAGSNVSLEILADAAPDGHTLMMLSATTVVYPLLYKSRFDIARDFTPISQVTAQGYVLEAHPSLPVKTALDLVKYLKANPGKLNYASTGIGSPIHMSTELFQVATGTQAVHIPYKGMGAAYPDLLGGRINFSFATIISSMPYIKSGRVRALGVTTPKRAPALPDVPTMAEAGVPNVVVVNWYGLIAPKGTPKPIVDRIAAETIKAVQSPEMKKRLIAEGSEGVGGTPAEFTKHLHAEHAMWSKVIKEAGIKGNNP